jgi:hypothetical protein
MLITLPLAFYVVCEKSDRKAVLLNMICFIMILKRLKYYLKMDYYYLIIKEILKNCEY